jgi:hypothetical protein
MGGRRVYVERIASLHSPPKERRRGGRADSCFRADSDFYLPDAPERLAEASSKHPIQFLELCWGELRTNLRIARIQANEQVAVMLDRHP